MWHNLALTENNGLRSICCRWHNPVPTEQTKMTFYEHNKRRADLSLEEIDAEIDRQKSRLASEAADDTTTAKDSAIKLEIMAKIRADKLQTEFAFRPLERLRKNDFQIKPKHTTAIRSERCLDLVK
jgi:hypothetical protein